MRGVCVFGGVGGGGGGLQRGAIFLGTTTPRGGEIK